MERIDCIALLLCSQIIDWNLTAFFCKTQLKVVQKTMTFYSLSPNCSLLLLLKSSLATNSLELM